MGHKKKRRQKTMLNKQKLKQFEQQLEKRQYFNDGLSMVKLAEGVKLLWRGILKIHDFQLTLPTRIKTKDRGRYYSSLLLFADAENIFKIFDKRLSTAQKIISMDQKAVISGVVSADLRERNGEKYLVIFPLSEDDPRRTQEPDAHLILVSVPKDWDVQFNDEDVIFSTMIQTVYKKLFIVLQKSDTYTIITHK